jgi:glycosyltransferase involved in cell wall biosynthesis
VKRVLFLGYHFPPVGGAGVQRNAKFARYLPDFGYESIVVTGPGDGSGRWTPTDSTLLDEIPPSSEVLRVPGPEPAESVGRRCRIERLLGRQGPWSNWWIEQALTAGRELARNADVIYAAMAPYESAEVAHRLARETGKPWVADLQDPWALDEMWVYPTGLHHRLELGRMRRLLGSADAIVMNTNESAERVKARFPELARKPMVSIPNGFDPADFAEPPPERSDDAFRIVHTGYLHTELGRHHRETALARRLLGGMNGKVDILTRSHVYLMEALQRLVQDDTELSGKIELHLAGVLSNADREAGAKSLVKMRGYLTHAESVALIRSADLLFLPMHDLPAGGRISIVPGKTYEYLASGRPILAAVPDGDARDLLDRCGGAFLCRPPDSAAMAGIVAAELARWRAGRPTRPQRSPHLLRYERRHLASELAAVFDRLLGSPGVSVNGNGRQPTASAPPVSVSGQRY